VTRSLTTYPVLPASSVEGNTPSIYKYTSQDLRSAIITEGYFNELAGILKIGDWIYIDSDIDGTVGHSIYFIGRDGTERSGAKTVVVVAGGTGYVVKDLVTVTYTDGTVVRNTICRVTSVAAGVVTGIELADPGTFSTNPTALTALATAKLFGAGNDDLTVTITLETDFGDIWFSPNEIVAA